MKKVISVLLSVIACLMMVACGDSHEPTDSSTPPSGGTEQSDGGNVVNPIRPGGDYNGGGY